MIELTADAIANIATQKESEQLIQGLLLATVKANLYDNDKAQAHAFHTGEKYAVNYYGYCRLEGVSIDAPTEWAIRRVTQEGGITLQQWACHKDKSDYLSFNKSFAKREEYDYK